MRERFNTARRYTKRFNQVVLSFPVWIIVGVAGIFNRARRHQGWVESKPMDNPEKMY